MMSEWILLDSGQNSTASSRQAQFLYILFIFLSNLFLLPATTVVVKVCLGLGTKTTQRLGTDQISHVDILLTHCTKVSYDQYAKEI